MILKVAQGDFGKLIDADGACFVRPM